MKILPPPPGKCQVCACEHPEDEPHNAQSFYYQYIFSCNNNRRATWSDAMLHCPEVVKLRWTNLLEKMGIDPNSEDLTGGIKTVEERDLRLSNL